ncbi:hypothetical protein AGR4B_Cc61255 [Agrobacterium tumefaciens str. CFBP 5621]|nr:hypothetical protein AGR4B_Cc61255 [Agrobacterium tumefaciens str. CFBP 5621]
MLENPLVSEVNKVFLNYRPFRRSLALLGKDDGNFCFLIPLNLTCRHGAHGERIENHAVCHRFLAQRFDALAQRWLRYCRYDIEVDTTKSLDSLVSSIIET